MSLSNIDQMAAEMAVWFLSKVTGKLAHSDVAELESLIEFFKHRESYVVSIGDDERLTVSRVAKSRLPEATEGDKVLCAFWSDGVFVVFVLFVNVSGDQSGIHQTAPHGRRICLGSV